MSSEDPAVQRALHVRPDHLHAEGWDAAQDSAFAHGADLPVINVAHAREEEDSEGPYSADFSALLDAAASRSCVFLIISRDGGLLPDLPVDGDDDDA